LLSAFCFAEGYRRVPGLSSGQISIAIELVDVLTQVIDLPVGQNQDDVLMLRRVRREK
jgi:hypothetical protein